LCILRRLVENRLPPLLPGGTGGNEVFSFVRFSDTGAVGVIGILTASLAVCLMLASDGIFIFEEAAIPLTVFLAFSTAPIRLP
jgi:hypothetical protein